MRDSTLGANAVRTDAQPKPGRANQQQAAPADPIIEYAHGYLSAGQDEPISELGITRPK